MPQPSLGRSVVDVCRPGLPCADRAPAETVGPSFRRLSRNRQGRKCRLREDVPIFPGAIQFSPTHRQCDRGFGFCRFFPKSRNECRRSPLCPRMVSAVSMHCPAGADTAPPPPNRLHPGAAGSVPGACSENQPIPISTAILIRSEWFFAPSFCLSRDVVLATVL